MSNLKRQNRKNQHLLYAVKLDKNEYTSGLEEIHLIPDSLPNLNLEEIDTNTHLGNLKLKSPLIINAITGGTSEAKKINDSLARAARVCEIPIAVGSQTAALEKGELKESFQIVRKAYPKGLIFANIGAHISVEKAKQAIEMVEANALQIHLNVPQELAMAEGDRNFAGYLENIRLIQEAVNVPVIVKEVGFGLSKETVKKLSKTGIKIIDVGGKGGTNFIAIEKARCSYPPKEDPFLNWGIPTAVSLIESLVELESRGDIIASGGINNGLELAKAVALGAQAGGIAGLFLRTLVLHGEEVLIEKIEELKRQLRMAMLMVGAKDIDTLQRKPLVILGNTAQWLEQRNINIKKYARR